MGRRTQLDQGHRHDSAWAVGRRRGTAWVVPFLAMSQRADWSLTVPIRRRAWWRAGDAKICRRPSRVGLPCRCMRHGRQMDAPVRPDPLAGAEPDGGRSEPLAANQTPRPRPGQPQGHSGGRQTSLTREPMRQRQQADVVRRDQVLAPLVPTRTVADDDRNRARCNLRADFLQMLVHSLRVGAGMIMAAPTPRAGQMAPKMWTESRRLSRTISGHEPMGAHMQARVPFWPTLASS